MPLAGVRGRPLRGARLSPLSARASCASRIDSAGLFLQHPAGRVPVALSRAGSPVVGVRPSLAAGREQFRLTGLSEMRRIARLTSQENMFKIKIKSMVGFKKEQHS